MKISLKLQLKQSNEMILLSQEGSSRKDEWNFYLQTSKFSHKGKGGTGMDGERFDQKNFMTIVTVKPEMVG